MAPSKHASLVLLLLFGVSCTGFAKPAYKHLAGGPSEFLPPADPASAAVESHIRLLRDFQLSPESDIASEEQQFLVDSKDFTFVILSSSDGHLSDIEASFRSPNGKAIAPSYVSGGPFGLGGNAYPSKSLYFNDVQHGEWSVTLQRSEKSKISAGDEPLKAFTFVTFSDGDSPVSVSVSAGSLNTLVGESLELRAVVRDPTSQSAVQGDGGTPPCAPNQARVETVDLMVRHPSGKTTREPMHNDDSSTNKLTPAFVASLALAEVGSYQAEVVVQGQRCDGKVYERTAWYWLTAVEKSATLSGHVIVTPSTAEYHRDVIAEQVTINLLLGAPKLNAVPASPPYRVYAEIFSDDAKSGNNSAIPVAWIGGLSDVSEVQSSPALSLHLDTSWLQGHGGPFQLRNVRVEELETYSTVASVAVLDLPLDPDTVRRVAAMKPVETITRAMRQGYHVGRKAHNRTVGAAQGPLLLVHGYCAPETPFTLSDFSGYSEFQDYRKNRLISDFGVLVAEFAAEHDSFGIVAHSQGGLAVLDMYAYLATGLDNAVGERRIQTLATPFRGSPLSGLLAIIGDLLGFGCGDNKDLSYDGTTKWLAGIPVDARSEVYYYTGQYSTGNLINYCILAANAVLSWPNDGMVEYSRTDLSGGHDMGHSKGQCHSVDMRDPPIAKNHERNVLMNSLAAR
ncbi:conditioned medium factor-like [Sycon ciliatum]|uniref:conditioned medium factor-like n=1 Tax=Sycon ciliatum TaxID=27933 RepID=UPI0031F66306